jgi:hypothetical protein
VPQTVGEETRAGKVDDEEVDDELGDLQRREVLLPLRTVSGVPFQMIDKSSLPRSWRRRRWHSSSSLQP